MKQLIDRTGEVSQTKRGETIKIVNYNGSNDIDVEFLEYNYIVKHTSYGEFKKGSIKCPYSRTVYNVGYLGEDFYRYKRVNNLKEYQRWRNMLKRCYCESQLATTPEYNLITVYEKWHNFSEYYKWDKEYYYEIPGEKMCLDKDIRNKKTYQYNPENCMFVPHKINVIFEKMNKEKCKNRNDLPLGVQWIKQNNIYGASCRVGNNKPIWLGRSHDPMECFRRYKICKENYIKQVADEYKEYLPTYIYDILYSYKIEIND